MSITRTIVALVVAGAAVACSPSADPRDVSVSFIENLSARQWDAAAALSTPQSQPALRQMQDQAPPPAAAADLRTAFLTDSLQPFLSGNSALVQNEVLTLHLQKVDGQWKVEAREETLAAILERGHQLADAAARWSELQQHYQRRADILKEYTDYLKANGLATAESQELEAALTALPPASAEWSAQSITAYGRAQHALEVLADRAVQPAQNASAGLSMNYIIALGEQSRRIHDAQTAYNEAAARVPASPYTPLTQ